ncbi:MAG: hypothetical protein UT05_C0004G0040 [Parcubacteria group bacterium GW2011_GWF2_38_76]|nr:MAG: hypothetical protein UT05_C0004G0040 [Parcubacteria group bacterium GW2011_GWF2_38_76]
MVCINTKIVKILKTPHLSCGVFSKVTIQAILINAVIAKPKAWPSTGVDDDSVDQSRFIYVELLDCHTEAKTLRLAMTSGLIRDGIRDKSEVY